MVYEYEAKERQLRVLWGDLASIRAKRCAEALKGRGGRQLGDLILGLLRDELALEVCGVVSANPSLGAAYHLQCSCFPVKTEPSGGTDIMENLEKLVSFRAGCGRAAGGWGCWACGSPKFCTDAWGFIVVGSSEPLSCRAGTFPEAMMS
jgi:hypothetical protein